MYSQILTAGLVGDLGRRQRSILGGTAFLDLWHTRFELEQSILCCR